MSKRISEADAVNLANHFGRAPQEFAGAVGLSSGEAATQLALDPLAVADALGASSTKAPSKAAKPPSAKRGKRA